MTAVSLLLWGSGGASCLLHLAKSSSSVGFSTAAGAAASKDKALHLPPTKACRLIPDLFDRVCSSTEAVLGSAESSRTVTGNKPGAADFQVWTWVGGIGVDHVPNLPPPNDRPTVAAVETSPGIPVVHITLPVLCCTCTFCYEHELLQGVVLEKVILFMNRSTGSVALQLLFDSSQSGKQM